ncbi:DUF4861 domain-containing protein [Flammeovirga aprica]|nr:DUF4861 domain-containing protein [Flammeovirga aprica]
MKQKSTLFYRLCSVMLLMQLLFSCSKNNDTLVISINNTILVDRINETIELDVQPFEELIKKYGYENLAIENTETGELLINQWIDLNDDKVMNQWLFQIDIKSNSKLSLVVRPLKSGEAQPSSQKTTYSRFVPERTDDYAWENDRVALRTFGPDAQRRAEANEYGGTLTSGIDAWLKKVDYPIIDKWYKNNSEKEGAYHIDTGEGYDPYHVGPSRGIGGIGFWVDDSLYTSKNFTSYKTISEGPIRTVFQLSYAPWEVNGQQIAEEKIISLDLGSNLCHFHSKFTTEGAVPQVAVGITLHDNKGEVLIDNSKGIYSYWEKIDDVNLGLGVVMPSQLDKGFEKVSDHKDASHLLVLATPNQSEIDYYAGFGWEKSKQFASEDEWNQYLHTFMERVKNPVSIEINKI